MDMLRIFVLGCLYALAEALEGVDVVLSCSLIEDGGGMDGMGGVGGGVLFTRTPATLVLRNMAVTPDLSLESVTPYNAPETPNPDDLIFEAKVSSVQIPDACVLLHADCNEQEVICEISRYFPRGMDPDTLPAHFIGSIQVEGGEISYTLVLQTLSSEETASNTPPLIQSKLELPLSPSGTLQMDTVFVVFSRSPTFVGELGGDATLDCGFNQMDTASRKDVGLEWRLQHKGKGRKILQITPMGEDADTEPTLEVGREGLSADPALLLSEGNASLTLRQLKVSDEGTYICTISTGQFQTQQVIQLHITKPPRVSLSEETLIFPDLSPLKLSCHCHRYYPLDVEVEWLSLSPSGEEEPVELSGEASLSSHRQHSDGTFSLSSHLFVRPVEHPPGSKLTCRVSHRALHTPSEHSLTVRLPEPEKTYWIYTMVIVLTVMFLYQVYRTVNKLRTENPSKKYH